MVKSAGGLSAGESAAASFTDPLSLLSFGARRRVSSRGQVVVEVSSSASSRSRWAKDKEAVGSGSRGWKHLTAQTAIQPAVAHTVVLNEGREAAGMRHRPCSLTPSTLE